MGNPGGWDGSANSWPPHKVVLDDFYIQRFEVTQADYELFLAVAGYESSDERYDDMRAEKPGRFEGTLPAVASWEDADAFCQWLGRRAGKDVRLPTEAEWEFAARARGRMLRYATENGKAEAGVTMAAKAIPGRREPRPSEAAMPTPPGAFPPNPLGLYDMSGNVNEWVSDNYLESYYAQSPVDNPKGPTAGQRDIFEGLPYRVLRGGDYENFSANTTVSRRKGSQTLASEVRGFRCSASSGI